MSEVLVFLSEEARKKNDPALEQFRGYQSLDNDPIPDIWEITDSNPMTTPFTYDLGYEQYIESPIGRDKINTYPF